MSTVIEQLKAPFPANKIHWRVGAMNKEKTSGLGLAYLNARDVMERLDDVVGAENWQAEYPFPGCCRIGVRLSYDATGDKAGIVGDWVWKSNGADQSDVEGVKGQYSDAFKRAGVLWGIGRYLYDLDNIWCDLKPQGRSHVIKNPPKLPVWALPAGSKDNAPTTPTQEAKDNKKPLISNMQKGTLGALMTATDTDEAPFCSWLGIERLGQMPADMFDRAVKALEDKQRKMK